MRVVSCVVALFVASLCVASAAIISDASSVLSDDLVGEVNLRQSQWKAGHNSYFGKWTIGDAKYSMGVRQSSKGKYPRMTYPSSFIDSLPTSFDSRQQWPNCTGPVLNQGKCGSCWAFGAVESASDRLCIHKKMPFYQLAPLDLTTCDEWNNGCDGGNLGTAWSYLQNNGAVTESCYPYGTAEGGPITTCAPSQQPCLPPFQSTPSCTQQCDGGASWSGNKTMISNVYGVYGADDMAAEIYKNGPIEAAFTVYQDFVHYKSGVYRHTTGSMLGGHAIKIIGWGVEDSTKYWLVQNSWTTTWGEQGYFKILRGEDECGIEDDGFTGIP